MEPTYDKHHLRGKKKDFRWRFETLTALVKLASIRSG